MIGFLFIIDPEISAAQGKCFLNIAAAAENINAATGFCGYFIFLWDEFIVNYFSRTFPLKSNMPFFYF